MESKKVFGNLPHLLTFPFKGDGAFGKLAIAAGLMLLGMIIPIIPTIFLLGYLVAIMTKIIVDHEEASMPVWDDWGKLFMDGLKLLGVTLIIALPLGVIFVLVFGFSFVPIAFMDAGVSEDAFVIYFLILFAVEMIAIFLAMFVSIFGIIFQPVYTSHMVSKGEFKAIFQIKQWWRVFKKSFWEFVISFFIFSGLYTILIYLYMILVYSVICCCLAPFGMAFMLAYIMIVYFALTASAYRDGMDKLGLKPGEPKAPPAQPKAVEPAQEFSLPSATPEVEAEGVAAEAAPLEKTVEVIEEIEVEVVNVVEEELVPDPIPEPIEPAYAAATIKMDKLQKINGIGPKTAAALNAAGIVNFSQLAETSEETLKQILTDAGLDIVIPACGDWPRQAKDLAK